jgi:hypothetical protein
MSWKSGLGATDPRLLPDNLLRKMSPVDRQQFGKHCKTAEERHTSNVCKSEREMQKNIDGLLRQRGIVFYRARMDKATTGTLGWPDFTLCAKGGRMICLECKMPGEQPTPEQIACMAGLMRAGAFVRVVHSESEALKALADAEAEQV